MFWSKNKKNIRGGPNEYPQSVFWSKNKKNIFFFSDKIFNFYNSRKTYIFHERVFVMLSHWRIWDTHMLDMALLNF